MEEREYSLCVDCKHQNGTWVNDREVDTWCTIKKGVDCDEVLMAKEQIFNCNNCKYHKDEKRDDIEHFSYPYSYCERKRCRLGSRERNWEGSWEQCRYTCFVPNEQTKRYIYNSLLMVG